MNRPATFSIYQPQLGCLLLALVMFSLCMMPLFLIDAAQQALEKLHFTPSGATAVLVAIFLGSLINLPVYVVEHDSAPAPPSHNLLYDLRGWVPIVHRLPTRTIIAVNVGGCVIPAAIAIFEARFAMAASPQAQGALIAVALTNIFICYAIARPIPGLGIIMPAFTPPAVSVLMTWLLLPSDEFAMVRAPVAFVAGVAGPLIGADLLHLRDATKLAAPVMSIGGAGTFDGIVLSGLLAAFLA